MFYQPSGRRAKKESSGGEIRVVWKHSQVTKETFSVHENAFSIIKKTFSGHYPQGFFVIAAPHPPNPINLNQSTGHLCLDK